MFSSTILGSSATSHTLVLNISKTHQQDHVKKLCCGGLQHFTHFPSDKWNWKNTVKIIIMGLRPTSPSWGPVESQGQVLFSVDAASLLRREQNGHEPVCAPWPPTWRSVLGSLLFSSRDVSIKSTQKQSCLQKTPYLNRKVNYFASQR